MNNKAKIKGMLGLARKAGSMILGTELALEAVKVGRAESVFLACDASSNTFRRIENICKTYSADIYRTGLSKEELAQCVGKKNDLSTVAISNKSFESAIAALCDASADTEAVTAENANL